MSLRTSNDTEYKHKRYIAKEHNFFFFALITLIIEATKPLTGKIECLMWNCFAGNVTNTLDGEKEK